VSNLAAEPKYQVILREMRCILANWVIETDDRGRFTESEAMYDSDMRVYINDQRRSGNLEYADQVEANVKQMKSWAAEGK
jgi:hypothetical protein